MTRIEHTVQISRPPLEVWRVLIEIERWPEWTPTVRSIRQSSGRSFAVGSVYRISQPGLLPATWRVTRIDEGRAFDWVTRPLPGTRIFASHTVDPDGEGTRLSLSVLAEGPLAVLVLPMFVPMSRRNLPIEAEGLRRRCERD